MHNELKLQAHNEKWGITPELLACKEETHGQAHFKDEIATATNKSLEDKLGLLFFCTLQHLFSIKVEKPGHIKRWIEDKFTGDSAFVLWLLGIVKKHSSMAKGWSEKSTLEESLFGGSGV